MGAEFASKLAALRKKQPGLTQVKLAAEIGADPSAVSRWERGDGEPHLAHLRELARFFGVTADELISDGGFDDHQEHEVFQKFLGTSDGQYATKRDWIKHIKRMRLPGEPTVRLYRELVRVLKMAYYPEDE